MAAVWLTAALLTAAPAGVVAVVAEPTDSLIPRRVLDPLDPLEQCPLAAGPRFTLFRHTGGLGAIAIDYFSRAVIHRLGG